MRSELERIEQIENYLLGKLSGLEREDFEERLTKNKALARDVELQGIVIERVQLVSWKEKIKKASESDSAETKLPKNRGNRNYYFIAAVVLILSSVAYLMLTEEEYSANEAQLAMASHIVPPIEGVDVPYTIEPIEVDQENVLYYQSGSMVVVPAFAFEDSNGVEVKGIAEIKFREFSDATDLYLSGIPMDYSIEGDTFPFESAAMCEIYALQNGKELKLKRGKEIEIMQASYTTSSAFNLYKFDQEKGEWIDRGKDIGVDLKEKPTTIPMSDSLAYSDEVAIDEESSLLDQLREVPPIKPKEANSNKLNFSIAYEKREFPELAGFDNVLFEIDETSSDFKAGDENIEWEDVQISKGRVEGTYTVLFSKKTTKQKRRYSVYPVFEEGSFNQALKIYNRKLSIRKDEEKQRRLALSKANRLRNAENLSQEIWNQYIDSMNLMIESRNARIEKLNLETEQSNAIIMAEKKRMDSVYQALSENAIKRNQVRIKNNQLKAELNRVYSIDQFGIWNCDSPMNLPSGGRLVAKFMYKDNELGHVVLVDKGIRGLFNYRTKDYEQFKYNPASDNVIWTVENQKVIYFNDFSDVPKKLGSSHLFNMKEFTIGNMSYNEIKTAIDEL